MKCILYIFCLSMPSLSAWAQIPKGTSTIGGSISASYEENGADGFDKDETSNIGIQPGYGYFIINNLSIGATVGGTLHRWASGMKFLEQRLNQDTYALSVGPSVRYYLPIGSKLYAHALATYAWQWSKAINETVSFDGSELGSYTLKDRSSSWTVGAGLSYFLTPHAALEGTLAYNHLKQPTAKDGNSSLYGVSEKTGSLMVSLGFRLFLRKAN